MKRHRPFMRKALRPHPKNGETPSTLRDLEVGRLVMVHLFGAPVRRLREIAAEIGTSRGTVFCEERRALRKLGAAIRRDFGDDHDTTEASAA